MIFQLHGGVSDDAVGQEILTSEDNGMHHNLRSADYKDDYLLFPPEILPKLLCWSKILTLGDIWGKGDISRRSKQEL